MNEVLKAPFPWFGGKRRVADEVWAALGNVDNYVEPFFGSGAVLLGRPHDLRPGQVETMNDADSFVVNAWRAIAADPEGVARHADWPVNETDLIARHMWLVKSGRSTMVKTTGGNMGNRHSEVLWLSPGCELDAQQSLW